MANAALSRLQHHVFGAIARGEGVAVVEQPATLLTTIPFSGFYESWHNDAIDQAEASLTEDSNGDSIDGLASRFHNGNSIDHDKVRQAYAKDYAATMATELGITLEFDELKSPREYNFETDRIFCKISIREAYNLLGQACKGKKLHQAIKGKFTSRPGFISYYSNELSQWPGRLEEWDHNQIGTLLEVVAAEKFNESEYAGELSSNGDLDNIIDRALTPYGQRLAKVASYLRERQDRL